jgi:hypothetical protein
VYDASFASRIRSEIAVVKTEFGLSGSESWKIDRLTGTPEWCFELGGNFAVKNLNLGLAKTTEGCHFLAGLWDADGGWYPPDGSHPLGQARVFGNYHTVRTVKHHLRVKYGVRTGRKSIVTPEGHRSKIGDYTIVTRTNVYGTGVLARSMPLWIDLIGSKMLLKGRPELIKGARNAVQEKSFTP